MTLLIAEVEVVLQVSYRISVTHTSCATSVTRKNRQMSIKVAQK